MTFAEKGGWWVAAQLGLFAGVVLGGRLDLAPLRLRGAESIGAILAGLGLAIGLVAALQLRLALTPYPEPVAGARLVQSGLYGLVRHPIYTAVIVGLLGVGSRQHDAVSLGFALSLIPFFWMKSRHEETRLLATYPEYPDYARKVRYRLIPGLL